MSFYDELVAATETERNELLSIPFIQMGAAGKLSLESYVAFLTQAYHHVKHTTPLLMATGGRLSESLEWLRDAVAEYIEEELGHQEWILNDIAACGSDKEAVRKGVPLPATELMVAYAYDTVYRKNPVGFFGMVLVLEGTSVSLATHAAANIETSLGLPKSAFSYLNSHGSLDISHVDFYEKLMNRLESEDDKQTVIHCAKMVYKLYGDIFRSLPLIERGQEKPA
ncbi:MAG: biliverdin-producing heme oxygenase [Zetaproteobacteria bacterium CG1_02_53_45]|nr:MAG: biliverdin-producing heme oxygenase [Zetaproteobacteria bacterium CG1_02_53_45]